MMGLVLLAGYLLTGFLSLLVAWELIRRRARAARVRPFRFELVSGLGYWVGAILAPGMILAASQWTTGARPEWWPGFVVPLLGWVGGALGAWAGVGYLRIAAATDPDYAEGEAGPERPSLEADVPEARDGDHVGPN